MSFQKDWKENHTESYAYRKKGRKQKGSETQRTFKNYADPTEKKLRR